MKDQKILFEDGPVERIIQQLVTNKSRKMIHFLNQHDLYQSSRIERLNTIFSSKHSLNVIDGAMISFFLKMRYFKRIRRVRGPTLTRTLLSDKRYSEHKRHFFIGFDDESLQGVKKVLPHLKHIKGYNPPYIKKMTFSDEEIKKIAHLIDDFKTDYVWIGIAAPKQNLLSDSLFPKTKAHYFFNIGAAMDFLIGKKKEAPRLIQSLGIEWLYRLVTDFSYTKKKVWRSFIGLYYLNRTKVRGL